MSAPQTSVYTKFSGLPESVRLPLSGERLSVLYRITGDEATARAKADAICTEQTVEFPRELLPQGDIAESVVGRIESVAPARSVSGANRSTFEINISFPVEAAAGELTQLLNVLFGNVSLFTGVRIQTVHLPDSLLSLFKGARFGRDGLRQLLGVPYRPLLCTALKPMGLSASDLAHQASQCAAGGIDFIKDDHGLSNQSFAIFRERVSQCADAVAQANIKTGGRSRYIANITAPQSEVLERAHLAKSLGAGGFLISPGLTGFDMMRTVADSDDLALPVFAHPAFLGSFVTNPDGGIAHRFLFGDLMRLAGADATIFPNVGGRFSFSQTECEEISNGCASDIEHLKKIFPMPGGGMSLERVPDMLSLYGREVVFLMGAGLHRHSPDLIANCRHFLTLVSQM